MDEKLTIVLKCLNDEYSLEALEREYGCSARLIGSWVEKYNALGVEGLKRKAQRAIYTTEQKEKMIHEVIMD